MLTETAARWILVLHTAIGASTHVVLWLRKRAAIRTIRKLAYLSLGLHAAAFLAGNAMYPTYKVEVRTAYLESSEAIALAQAAHQRQLDRTTAREAGDPIAPSATGELVKRAAAAACTRTARSSGRGRPGP